MLKPLPSNAAAAVLPPRVDVEMARKLISERYFPITRGTLIRLLADLPRIYVGRSAIYETTSVLAKAEHLLHQDVPRRGRPAADRGGLA